MLRTNFKMIAILCLISSLARFVLDSYLPSLPAIGRYFAISDTQTQLTLTIYLFGFGISQLIYGPLSDRYGRKMIIFFGMLLFFIGSFVCSIATSSTLLLISRLITGFGAGACGVLNRAIASDCFKGTDFSKVWSYTTTTLVITLIVAPLLGGYIQDTLGWRGNFILSTFLIAVVFGIVARFLPETHHRPLTSSLRVRTILSNYYQILMTPSFLISTLCYTLAFSGLMIYFQVSPLLYINEFGLSPTQYGWCSMMIAVSYLMGGTLVNKMSAYLHIRTMLFMGTILLMSGGITMLIAYAFNEVNLLAVLFPSAIYVVGARVVIPNAIASGMSQFRHANGSSSALIGFIQMLGSSILSLLIANCNYETPFPLALFFTLLGMSCLIMILFMHPTRQFQNE